MNISRSTCYSDYKFILEHKMNTSIRQPEEAILTSPMKKKNLISSSLEGSPAQIPHSYHPGLSSFQNCEKCDQLQNQLQFLGEQIVKLNQLQKDIKGKYRQRYDDSKAHAKPLDQHVIFDIDKEEVIIRQLQQKIKSICESSKREIEILSKLMQRSITEFPPETLESQGRRAKQIQGDIDAMKTKPEEIQEGIEQMLSNSAVIVEKEKSQLSGSLTSEHKSMIQRMTPEEREAYYSKNMKNRKVMAKLKKKK